MENRVPRTLATKLARYWSSSATLRRQNAARMRKVDRGTRNIMTGVRSTAHRSVLTNAPGPRDPVRHDPDAEPDQLCCEPTHDRVRAIHLTREGVHREGEHGAEPQGSYDTGHRRRQQRERGDAAGEEQGHPRVQ